MGRKNLLTLVENEFPVKEETVCFQALGLVNRRLFMITLDALTDGR